MAGKTGCLTAVCSATNALGAAPVVSKAWEPVPVVGLADGSATNASWPCTRTLGAALGAGSMGGFEGAGEILLMPPALSITGLGWGVGAWRFTRAVWDTAFTGDAVLNGGDAKAAAFGGTALWAFSGSA